MERLPPQRSRYRPGDAVGVSGGRAIARAYPGWVCRIHPDAEQDGTVAELARLAALLMGYGVEFCVIGGLAVHRWLPEHAPSDLDIVLQPGSRSGRRARRGLQRLMLAHRDPYVAPIIPVSARQIGRGREVRLQTAFGRLDVVGDSLPEPYAAMSARIVGNCDWVSVADLSIPLCSLTDLITIKEKTGREKDAGHALDLRAVALRPGPGSPRT